MKPEMFKIIVNLKIDDEGFPPFQSESLWAFKVSSTNFKIDSIPFYCEGISLGDVVRVKDVNGEFIFDGVVECSGNTTINIIFYDEKVIDFCISHLRHLNCLIETSNIETYTSISISQENDISSIKFYLDSLEQKNFLSYRESSLHHLY